MAIDFTTIVSGLPRSGTSVMMQMIAAGGIEPLVDHVRSPDADNPRGYFEFEAVKKVKHDKSWLDGAQGKVVKMVHLLLTELPDDRQFRIVLMRRNITEVLASQKKMLERSGRKGGALPEEQMARLFEDQLVKVKAWVSARPSFRLLEVGYSDVVSKPEVVAATVSEFLGGSLDLARMVAAVDPSLYRNRSA